MLLLDHVGAKSGTQRTSPLLYFRDGDDLVDRRLQRRLPEAPGLVPQPDGQPDTEVQVGSEQRAVHARVATDEERERLWPVALKQYHGYADYQARSKGREIPLVILEPR